MRLSDITDCVRIETVRTGEGCPECCVHCGAYQRFDKRDSDLTEVTEEQLRANLDKQVEGTRLQLVDLFANYVTTDVNTEPLRGDIFPFFARLVYQLSGGKSKVVCISHGMYAKSEAMRQRLQEIAELMEQGIVPLFVLTVDFARRRGKMSEDKTKASYYETLQTLRPILTQPDLRVIASIQGNDDPESHFYRANAWKMFQEVINKLNLDPDERAGIRFDTGRSYACVGRAAKFIPGLDPSGECTVIPDADFVKHALQKDHVLRALVDCQGRLYAQPNEPGRSYNTTVDSTAWTRVRNKPPVGGYFDLYPQDIEWEAFLEDDGDIFEVWPLTLIDEADRDAVLAKIYKRIGKAKRISQIRLQKDGQRMKVKFSEVKRLLVKWFAPREIVERQRGSTIYEREDDAASQLIHEASPDASVLDVLSGKDLADKELRSHDYYAGEVIALVRLLKEECGLEYIAARLKEQEGWEDVDI